MEVDRANVVQMVAQGEEAASFLVVPYLDLIVISTRNEERLVWVEGYAAYGA